MELAAHPSGVLRQQGKRVVNGFPLVHDDVEALFRRHFELLLEEERLVALNVELSLSYFPFLLFNVWPLKKRWA